MEPWMIYAILWAVGAWIYWIFQKIEVESKIVERDTFIFYPHLFWWLSVWIIMLLFDIHFIYDIKIALFAALVATLYVSVLRLRHHCLMYMSSSSYFINYRIFNSIALLIVGILFFSEVITFNEYVWIFLGFIIFYMLLEKKNTHQSTSDIKKWYLYLLPSVLLFAAIWMIQKNFTLDLNTMWSFVFYNNIAWGLFVLFSSGKKYKKTLAVKDIKAWLFLVLTGIFFGPPYFFHLYTLALWWDIAIVYKIISYSLFIPIIFSIIYYKEPVTWKKMIAFVLTILSIALFI